MYVEHAGHSIVSRAIELQRNEVKETLGGCASRIASARTDLASQGSLRESSDHRRYVLPTGNRYRSAPPLSPLICRKGFNNVELGLAA